MGHTTHSGTANPKACDSEPIPFPDPNFLDAAAIFAVDARWALNALAFPLGLVQAMAVHSRDVGYGLVVQRVEAVISVSIVVPARNVQVSRIIEARFANAASINI
jgi:hypothetical protein